MQQLKVIQENQPDNSDDNSCDEMIAKQDLQNDFASDEFNNKNVRVRPVSSYSLSGATKDSHVPEEDDSKFNADQLLELNIVRNAQKERKRKQLEWEIAEAEKAEKKKKSKQ